METRARKEDHLLEISHRFGLWSAKLRLEPDTLFLMLPLLYTLSPSLLFSSTYCIFLFPLQTIHACPVSLLLPRCLFLPAQHFFTSVVSWAQLRDPKGKWKVQPEDAVHQLFRFPRPARKPRKWRRQWSSPEKAQVSSGAYTVLSSNPTAWSNLLKAWVGMRRTECLLWDPPFGANKYFCGLCALNKRLCTDISVCHWPLHALLTASPHQAASPSLSLLHICTHSRTSIYKIFPRLPLTGHSVIFWVHRLMLELSSMVVHRFCLLSQPQ